jgi:hypothetical protein
MKKVLVWYDFKATERDRMWWRTIRKLSNLGTPTDGDTTEFIEIKAITDVEAVVNKLKQEGYTLENEDTDFVEEFDIWQEWVKPPAE